MDPHLSHKLSVLRLLAVVSIVWYHAYGIGFTLTLTSGTAQRAGSANDFLQQLWSLTALRWGLPFLSLLSGYLLFRGLTPSLATYMAKYRRRFRSLVVPFLLWSAFDLAYVFVALVVHSGWDGAEASIQAHGGVLYLWLVRPVAYQLWFIQTIVVCVLLAPLIYPAVRYTRGLVLVLAAAWWLFPWQADQVFPWMTPKAFFPFCVGAAVAILGWSAPRTPRWLGWLLAPVWLALCALRVVVGFEHGVWGRALFLLIIALGIAAVWLLYDVAAPLVSRRLPARRWLLALAPFSFFIYLNQKPTLGILRTLAQPVVHGSELLGAAAYVVLPLLTVGTSLVVAVLVKRWLPRLYAVLTGGRQPAPRAIRPEPVAAQRGSAAADDVGAP